MAQPIRVPDPDFPGRTILVEQLPSGEYQEVLAAPSASGTGIGIDPNKAKAEVRAAAAAERSVTAAERTAGVAEAGLESQKYNNALKLRSDYDALPGVKEYRVAISQLATGLKTKPDATGDNALIYAYAKTMDPGSVVRESEMNMAASADSVIAKAATGFKKQFGIDGGGQLSPAVREQLRREMVNKTAQMNKGYTAQRDRFTEDAKAFGIDPRRVIGNHDGDAFMDVMREYDASQGKTDARAEVVRGPVEQKIASMLASGAPSAEIKRYIAANAPGTEGIDAALAFRSMNPTYKGAYDVSGRKIATPAAPAAPAGYNDSYLSQALSGINKGAFANILGAPADLSTAVYNMGAKGINSLANTNLPIYDRAIAGSSNINDKVLKPLGMVGAPTTDPSKQFVRRVGESVGSALGPAGMAGSLGRAGLTMAGGLGGGVGGATAQKAFPGNPYAEMAGELAGGAGGATGALNVARRNATRQIEAAVPTIDQLKEQAGGLYRQAEARGVVADPVKTQNLADQLRTALAHEGSVSPTGRISEVYPKAKEAMQLADDYAGQTMSPTQLQTVRKVVSDGLSSKERTDRRLAGILTDTFDQWAAPLAPELPQARDIASRYLTAEQLATARELAGARVGQFTGSGFENALRTEYRALDRAGVKGNTHFSPDVASAVETVSRGTRGSNIARAMGRLYPSGPVSFGLGSGLPAIGAGLATGSPVAGGAALLAMTGLGGAGRVVATKMGIRAADLAELTARNGGALPIPNGLSPEAMRVLGLLGTAESAKYLSK